MEVKKVTQGDENKEAGAQRGEGEAEENKNKKVWHWVQEPY